MNGHPTREEDFDLYALGALEGDEKRVFETHLDACPECAQKLAEARGRVALLALAAPPAEPSVAVKVRLMKQVRESASTERPGQAVKEPEHFDGYFGRWWAAVLLPVGAALAIATVVLWMQNRQLDQQLASLRVDVQRQGQELQQARQVADLVSASDTMVVSLASQPGMPRGAAHVMYNGKMAMLMYEGELDPAPAGKSYQLWVVPAQGNPISAGVFMPGSDKSSHFMMKLPEGVTAKAFAVTLEPAGGRPQPTGPKVLLGAAS